MRKHNRIFNIIGILFIATFIVHVAFGASQRIIAIKGGTVLTMAGRNIPNGIVLIKGDKIEAVGTDVKIPSDAVIVDATGKFVMPGIIDAMTYYGVKPFDLNDETNPVTPQNRIIQAFYPYGEFMKGKGEVEPNQEILSGGVTTVYIAPGDRQVIGGQGAVLKTHGKNFDSMILREPAAIDMTIGDPPKQAFGARGQSPMTRMSIASKMRKALIKAQEYDRRWKAYSDKSEEEKKKASKPVQDLEMEPMLKLLHREIPARIEAELVNDIRTAIRITDEFNLDLIIDSGLSAYVVKDLLAEKKIPVVLGPTSHPFVAGGEVSIKPELSRLMDERNAALLAKAGVKIAIASFSYGNRFSDAVLGKWLLLEAGLATGFGLPEEEALKAVTINAAEILQVADRIGSLEPGKDADIVILDGHPLTLKTFVERVYINGELVYTKK
ncbi:amidohydrolase family protein [Acidobacteriota bacterium]